MSPALVELDNKIEGVQKSLKEVNDQRDLLKLQEELPKLLKKVAASVTKDLTNRLDQSKVALKDELNSSSCLKEHPYVASRRLACGGLLLQSYVKAIE